MSETKNKRNKTKQLGQFMTPVSLSKDILKDIKFDINDKVIEPSFGDGSFLFVIIDKFKEQHPSLSFDDILINNIWGVELDKDLYDVVIDKLQSRYGVLKHNLLNCDYLLTEFDIKFNYVIGNPPFGGTLNNEEYLDKKYGFRKHKIKKESYSFFIIKGIEELKDYGRLIYIVSDTFLTIKTMSGLRKYLYDGGLNQMTKLGYFSSDTEYPMLILDFYKDTKKNYIILDKNKIKNDVLILSENFSWNENKWTNYFQGEKLGDYIIASGGLTTGKNEYFIREIKDNKITENYNFTYFNDPITLEKEKYKSKYNKVSKNKKIGGFSRNIKIEKTDPFEIELPNDDYCYYNKSTSEILYSEPRHVIYWKDDGDAVLTYKKNNRWYLQGVGGANFFKKEGLTWQLISKKINARYLPSGFILDNSSPIAVLRDNVDEDELYFIIGWLLTDMATDILKNIINHTRNIQNKDIERLPYPNWVENKQEIVDSIKKSIHNKMNGLYINEDELINKLNKLYQESSIISSSSSP